MLGHKYINNKYKFKNISTLGLVLRLRMSHLEKLGVANKYSELACKGSVTS